MTSRQPFVVLFVLAALSGCSTAAADAKYPSLALRDVERSQGEFSPGEVKTLAVPPVETGLTGPLADRLAALVAQGERAHAGFAAAQDSAARLAALAAGASIGSDAWASAQVALADLDSARSEVAIALGELDTLYVAATTQAEDAAPIIMARERVLALVAQEDAVLEDLRSKVR